MMVKDETKKNHGGQCNGSTGTKTVIDDNANDPNKNQNNLEINEDDLEELIELILDDPSINIDMVPDSIERTIYKSTIQLILNIVFGLIGNINGLQILEGYEIRLIINNHNNNRLDDDGSKQATKQKNKEEEKNKNKRDGNSKDAKKDANDEDSSKRSLKNIDDKVLEEMALRFLRNDMVNRRFIPDAFERSLYKNCLKVIFRILHIVTSNLNVVICGHTFQLTLETMTWKSLVIKDNGSKRKTTTNSTTTFGNDDDLIDEIKILATTTSTSNSKNKTSSNGFTNFFDRLLHPGDHMMEKLYTTLYRLIAGILDDMLETTSIHLLSDQIYFDVLSEVNTTTTTTTTQETLPAAVKEVSDTIDDMNSHFHEDEKKEEEYNDANAAVQTKVQTTDDTTDTNNNNHDVVSREDVKELVDELLIQDPTLNIPILPDRIERMIYETVIELVLNILYGSLLGGDFKTGGLQIFASKSYIYKLRTRLHRLSKEQTMDENFSVMEGGGRSNNNNNINTAATTKSVVVRSSRKPNIDNKLLEQVVDILLQNKSINQQYLPDELEKLIYINCLKLIFQLLDVITTSFHISICGHDIGITLDPIKTKEAPIKDAVNVLSSYINNKTSDQQEDIEGCDGVLPTTTNTIDDPTNFWHTIVKKIRDDPGSLFISQKLIMENIQSTLNDLIVALVDNLLNQTHIQILSSQISLDIAAKKMMMV